MLGSGFTASGHASAAHSSGGPCRFGLAASPCTRHPGRNPEVDEIAAVLGPGGRLSRALPGYEHRPEQLTMARAVERAFDERQTTCWPRPAPAPARRWPTSSPPCCAAGRSSSPPRPRPCRTRSSTRTCRSFATPWGFRFGPRCLKGRANYLCLHRCERLRGPAPLPRFARGRGRLRDAPAAGPSARRPATARSWMLARRVHGSGGEVSTGARGCLGTRCPQYASLLRDPACGKRPRRPSWWW